MAITKTQPEPDQYILSFDPGGTTGMCLIRYNKNELNLSLLAQISDGHMGFYDNLVGVPGGYGTPTTIVSEKWVEHDVDGADRTPLVIEGIQYAFWPDQVVYQTPDMKHMISDDLLKEIGVWTPGKPHQMDALRHALVFLRNQMHQPTLEMLSEGTPMPQDGDDQSDESGEGQGQPHQIEAGAEERGAEPQAGEGQGDGEGQAAKAEPTDEKPQGGLAAHLAVLAEGIEDDTEGASLAQIAQDIYNRERDLDGAFAGYEADSGQERKLMIDEDF